jgi:hypothetical protein
MGGLISLEDNLPAWRNLSRWSSCHFASTFINGSRALQTTLARQRCPLTLLLSWSTRGEQFSFHYAELREKLNPTVKEYQLRNL